jgi:hypothetical protein
MLIDGATQPPRVEFILPSKTRGLDYVEEIRASATQPDALREDR